MNLIESGLGIWIGLNLLITFTIPGISIGGHIGGLIGGVLAAFVLFDVATSCGCRFAGAALCAVVARGGRRRDRGLGDARLVDRRRARGRSRSTAASAVRARPRDAAGGRAARCRRRAAGRDARSTPRRRRRRPARRGRQPLALAQRLRGGLLGVVAARHRDDDLRPRPPRAPPSSAVRDFSPGRPSTSSPPASSIICGTQWPPIQSGSSHSSAATRGRGAVSTASSTSSMRSAGSSTSASPASGTPAASASRGMSASTSPSVEGSSESTSRLGRQLLGDGAARRRTRRRRPRTPPG